MQFENKYANSFKVPEDIIFNIKEIVKEAKNISGLPYNKLATVVEHISNQVLTSEALDFLDNLDGIISFDYEIDPEITIQLQLIVSAAVFHCVNSALFNPIFERQNKTPFMTFKSIGDKITEMKNAGIPFYSPDIKLGFHNDAYIENGNYFLPKYVSLLNLFIGYDKPGNLYFINKNNLLGFEKLFTKGRGKKFAFRHTPIVYESKLMDIATNQEADDSSKKITAFWQNLDGQKFAFSNGEIKDIDDFDVIKELQDSLQNNPTRISVEQKINRIIIFRNDNGFHARDIFQEQKVFKGTTRLFLRAVSKEGHLIPQ